MKKDTKYLIVIVISVIVIVYLKRKHDQKNNTVSIGLVDYQVGEFLG